MAGWCEVFRRGLRLTEVFFSPQQAAGYASLGPEQVGIAPELTWTVLVWKYIYPPCLYRHLAGHHQMIS